MKDILRVVALTLCGVVLVAIVYASVAFAHQGSGSLETWFRSLTRADGFRCCGGYDCHVLEDSRVRIGEDGNWKVEIGGSWYTVPPEKVVRTHNVAGQPTLCHSRSFVWQGETVPPTIYCFVPGTLT